MPEAMARQPNPNTPTWTLFAWPAAIALPIVAGILLGGPAIGFLAAVVAALVILAVAVRMKPGREGLAVRKPDGADWRGAAARRSLVPVAIVVVGIVLVVIASGTARIIGWGVVAVGITVAVSLVFLEVGYSEERARGGRWRRGSPTD